MLLVLCVADRHRSAQQFNGIQLSKCVPQLPHAIRPTIAQCVLFVIEWTTENEDEEEEEK